LILNSGSHINLPDCEIHVQSEANAAATINSGINIDVQRTCIESGKITNNFGDFPNLELNCETVDDPFEGAMPAPPSTTCEHWNTNHNGGTIHLQPGVYCGHHNFNGNPTVHFAPGVYVLKNGSWNVNGGEWDGRGVTFYFDDSSSKIQFNSGVKATLLPPAGGTYSDILFYEREGLSQSNFVLNDDKGFEIRGLIYLPSRNTTYNSGGNWRSRALTMVFNKMIFNDAKLDLSTADYGIIPAGDGTRIRRVITLAESYRGRLVN